MKRNAKRGSDGFTIVELLIVIVVIAILAAIAILSYVGIQGRAAESGLKSDLRNGSKELGVLNATDGIYPPDDSALKASDGNAFIYTKNDDNTYCLTGYSNKYGTHVFHVENGDEILPGACSGHTVPDDNEEGGGSMACNLTPSSADTAIVAKLKNYIDTIHADAASSGRTLTDYSTNVDGGSGNILEPSHTANVLALFPGYSVENWSGAGVSQEIITDSDGYHYILADKGSLNTASGQWFYSAQVTNDQYNLAAIYMETEDGAVLISPTASVPSITSDLTSVPLYEVAGLVAYLMVDQGMQTAVNSGTGTSASTMTGADIVANSGGGVVAVSGSAGGPWVIAFDPSAVSAAGLPSALSDVQVSLEAVGSLYVKMTGVNCREA